MPNDNLSSSFPTTRQDVNNLKQTALDAAKDLGSTASVHADKAKSQLKDLANHARDEGSEQLNQVRGRLTDVIGSARDYAVNRPLTCIGVALAVGFLIGATSRGCSSDRD